MTNNQEGHDSCWGDSFESCGTSETMVSVQFIFLDTLVYATASITEISHTLAGFAVSLAEVTRRASLTFFVVFFHDITLPPHHNRGLAGAIFNYNKTYEVQGQCNQRSEDLKNIRKLKRTEGESYGYCHYCYYCHDIRRPESSRLTPHSSWKYTVTRESGLNKRRGELISLCSFEWDCRS